MSSLGQTFNANELPQFNSYEPLPAGWYNANITAAELRLTKDQSGQYIHICYIIIGPTHQGRMVFGNLNIKSTSARAEEIGRQQLGEMMRAIGLNQVTDTDQLIGGKLSIKLCVRAATDQYAAENDVKGFKAITGSTPNFAAPSDSAQAATAPAKATPPWARK